jgi:CzcA family heavy metal efflux pump
MFRSILLWSLKNRASVLVITLFGLLSGLIIVLNMPVDVLPNLNRPTVNVLTEAEGMAPEEVEALVTRPIENQLAGLPDIERIYSRSSPSLSVITLEFNWGSNALEKRQLVSERLQAAREQLPQSVLPSIGPLSSIMGEIMLVGLTSSDTTELRYIADWTIKPRLLSIQGVSEVTVIGGDERQVHVKVYPEKLLALKLGIGDVIEALENSNSDTSGGFLQSSGQEILIRNVGRLRSIEDVRAVPVTLRDGNPVTIGDLATVDFGSAVKRGDAGMNAKPAVIMAISKQPGASTIDLSQNIDRAFNEMRHSLPGEVQINRELFRQADFIERAIENVTAALRDGTILVILVLIIFLLNFRTTAITLTAIPVSFLVTFLVLKLFGASINTMTLGGISVAIGEIVDDSIVDIENIYRRLRESGKKDILRTILSASLEVRSSIVYATFITVLVFVPILMLTGIEGRLLIPLGLAYVTALLVSLVVSLTLTPVLASYLLRPSNLTRREDTALVAGLKRWDRSVLNFALDNPGKVMMGTALVLLSAFLLVPTLGSSFLPEFNEGSVTINVIARPGTSLEESNRIGQVAEKLLLSMPEIESTGRRTGRAEADEHAEGVFYTEIDAKLKRGETHIDQNRVRETLSVIPGVTLNIGGPISHRIDHLLSGVQSEIVIKLFGEDLKILRSEAEEIRNVLSSVEGASDVQIERQDAIPQLRVEIDHRAISQYGLRSGEVTEALSSALQGRNTTQLFTGPNSYDVVVKLVEESGNSPEAINNLTISNREGEQIPLRAVARISQSEGPAQIAHENGRRRIIISANSKRDDLGSVVDEIKRRVESQVSLPAGYFLEFAGHHEAQKRATLKLVALSLVSTVLIFLLLLKALGDWRASTQVMINIPLAIAGGIFAMALTGTVFSIATLVGFISLTGITVRNGIMMISHYIYLMRGEGEAFDRQMIIRGSLERLTPVLMTASTTLFSLIPLLLAYNLPGSEILHPLAVVLAGGMVTTTLLDQIVTPAIFYRFGRRISDRIHKQDRNEAVEEIAVL